LDVAFNSPVTDHGASDDCGVAMSWWCGSAKSTSNGTPPLTRAMPRPLVSR
jgi:hypothetical protein